MILVKPIKFRTKPSQDELIKFIDGHDKTQVVSPDFVPSKKNVEHAVKLTEKAYEEGENISHVPKIGLILHLTGQRQIKKAIEKAKVEGEEAVFICFKNNPEDVWKEFKNRFEFKEIKLPEASEEEIKKRMEKAATFWLNG